MTFRDQSLNMPHHLQTNLEVSGLSRCFPKVQCKYHGWYTGWFELVNGATYICMCTLTHAHACRHTQTYMLADLGSRLNSSEKRPSNSNIWEFLNELAVCSLTTLEQSFPTHGLSASSHSASLLNRLRGFLPSWHQIHSVFPNTFLQHSDTDWVSIQ